MHAVIFSCHASLSEQVGAPIAGTFLVVAEDSVVVELVFRIIYFESSESFLLFCIVRKILETIWSVMLIMLVLVFRCYVIKVIRCKEIQRYECD
jgi:hypothetical protein